jgi:hypothetical protein
MVEGGNLATKAKRLSMTEALRGREDVVAFLEAGNPKVRNESPVNRITKSKRSPEERIAVTVRLPKAIAHALIDASAERRKNREEAWSQQDIVAEAIEQWLEETRKKNGSDRLQ